MNKGLVGLKARNGKFNEKYPQSDVAQNADGNNIAPNSHVPMKDTAGMDPSRAVILEKG